MALAAGLDFQSPLGLSLNRRDTAFSSHSGRAIVGDKQCC